MHVRNVVCCFTHNFPAIFIHASLRLRNIKNKLVNKVEVLGLKKTPMGIFLEEFGLEPELF